MRPRLVIPVVGGLVLVALIVLRWHDPTALQVLRHRTFDAYQRLAPAPATDAPVTIVAIDEASLAAHGQWPWPRTLLADLVVALARAGAAAIAFDVVWAEPDRASAENVVNSLRGLEPATESALRALPSNDALFARAIASARVVLGQPQAAQGAGATSVPPKASYAARGVEPTPFLRRVEAWVPNLPILSDAAAGIGALTLDPDDDEVVRRPSLLVASDSGVFPVLALESLRVALSQPGVVTFAGPDGIDGLRVGPLLIPTDRRGRAWVRFSPHRAASFVSAADVLSGKLPDARFKGRLVVVGLTASGLQQVRKTPVGALSITEIHAQMAANMIQGTLLVRPPWSAAAEYGGLLVIGGLVIGGTALFGALGGLAIGGIAFFAAVGGTWTLFARHGLLIDATYPAFASLFLYLVVTVVGYVRERRQKREVRGAFAQYLSPALVERLAENPAALRIGGEMKPMTVLFSDIRGFTGIAERLRHDPEGLTRLINLYFTAMSDRLLEYGATIDKYIGDAVMAFWNAPLDDPAHAEHACRAALEMLDGLAKLNRKLAASGSDVRIDIGIGLNSGECLVGNVGSEHRFNYSVIGDTVNVAARLEAETKRYGARIIVGEATRALAPDFAFVELGTIRARGRADTTSIHALLGPPELANEPAIVAFAAAHGALLAACRAQDWPAARAALAAARAAAGSGRWPDGAVDLDRLHDLYDERIRVLEAAPLRAAWDGVFADA